MLVTNRKLILYLFALKILLVTNDSQDYKSIGSTPHSLPEKVLCPFVPLLSPTKPR